MELRVERVDDFHVEETHLRLQIDGWSTTGNVKVFLMTGRFQPFFNFGVGLFVAEIDHTHPLSDARSFTSRDESAVFRASSGFDLYLSRNISLNLSAAFVSLVGDLAYAKFGQLGGGLTFRF